MNVGLFGTCASSDWRKKFYKSPAVSGAVSFFSPMLEDGSPANPELIAKHLVHDDIVVFCITSESYGLCSIAELYFSLLHSSVIDDNRKYVIYIDTNLDRRLMDKALRKESLHGRRNLLHHVNELKKPNVHVANSVEDAFAKTKLLTKEPLVARTTSGHKYHPQFNTIKQLQTQASVSDSWTRYIIKHLNLGS